MKRVPLWAVFAGVFVVLFALCAAFLTRVPSTPAWVAGVTPLQQFVALVRLNGPTWAALSVAGAGVAAAAVWLVRWAAVRAGGRTR